jgi:translation initiation factor 2B subunit (eIF-2B alpha/beta/delta family)
MDKNQFKSALADLAVDRQQGAGALTRMCLQYAADSALHAPAKDVTGLSALLEERACQMVAARPGTAPLVNLLSRWRETLETLKPLGLEDARWTAAQSAMDLLQTSGNALREVAAKAQELVTEGSTVISHGAGSTITEVFRQCREKSVRAIVTETRPLDLGYQLAKKLSQWKVDTTLILEAQIGSFVGQADLAIVGAHSLLPDGSVVNTPGTYLLALAAHDQGIPFYVCCESFKRHPAGSEEPVLEEIPARANDVPHLEHVNVASIQLEVTPAWLVTAWITEQNDENDEEPRSG